MERNLIRSRARLILSSLSVALVLATAGGCSNPLDKARTAWSDGEGDFEEAEPLYEEAIENAKTKKEATAELVDIYVQLGKQNNKRFKVADGYFKKALALDPENEGALEGMARVMIA